MGNSLLNLSENTDEILMFDIDKKVWERKVPIGTSKLMKSQYRFPISTNLYSALIFGGIPTRAGNILEKLTLQQNYSSQSLYHYF